MKLLKLDFKKIYLIFAFTLILIVFLLLPVHSSAGSDTVNFNSGWNFVSFPVQLGGVQVETLTKDISSNLRVIWGYDNAQKMWVKYNGQGAGGQNTLATIESGKGYWVYMDTPATLTVTGGSASPQTITTYRGWNLIGHTGVDNLAIDGGLMGILGKWTSLWGWEGGTWKLKVPSGHDVPSTIPQLSLFNTNKAYWLKTVVDPGGLSFTIKTDFTAPTVMSASPKNATIDAQMVVQFSESMDPATINTNTFFVKDSSDNVLPGSVIPVDATATFVPSNPLSYSSTYTATVTTGAKDLAGNPLAAPYFWSFTTIGLPQEGIWDGTLTSNVSHTTSSVTGIVAGNRQVHFLDTTYGAQYVGSGLNVNGNNLSGTLNAYAPLGGQFFFPDGSSSGWINLSGTAVSRSSMTGTYSGVGDNGTFSLTYNSIYQRLSSLPLLTGNWSGIDVSSGYSQSLTLQNNGTFIGSNSLGCTFSSGFAAPINPLYNAYNVTMTITCPAPYNVVNGIYTGVAYLSDSGGTNNRLTVGISNATASIVSFFTKQP
jgi:hypothetical protein